MLKSEIFSWLDNSNFIEEYVVLDFKTEINSFYLKMKIIFIDKSILFTREFFDTKVRDYSFHWQDTDGNLICRWDNAPFHKDVPTFPHHKHNKFA